MDLETRVFVLNFALEIENSVSELVLLFLNIEAEKRKAITNKSGGLSFKNKIDILFDIEVLTDKEYNSLLLIMEYRNQFMHNYNCNSFCEAFEFIGSDKKNKLLSYVANRTDENSENIAKYAFENLFKELEFLIENKIEFYNNAIDKKLQQFNNYSERDDLTSNIALAILKKYFNLSSFIQREIESMSTKKSEKQLIELQGDLIDKINSYTSSDIEEIQKLISSFQISDDNSLGFALKNIIRGRQ